MNIGAVKRLFVGSPLATAQARHERLSKASALAVFSSDALSSVAYATEEILIVLVIAGTAALAYSIPIGLAIAALIAIVVSSYRQTILAYPQGGGAYIVTKDNLGRLPGLVSAGALLIDYVLTVAVSVAAGVAALTSAFPALYAYRIPLGVLFIAGIATMNLRGLRESSNLFAVPTYLFVVSFASMLAYGFVRWAAGWETPTPPAADVATTQSLTLFLVLRAFSSGCAALTGVEAVSDGVPAFRPPEARNARVVLTWLGIILIALFMGITFLARHFHVTPRPEETVVSQLARLIFGGGLLYYEIQTVTMLILVFAANTAFADFPRLAYFLARDSFIPRQFATRGDRLVFSNGILILGGLAALLVTLFGGDTHALIPLYAVGVFLSFTLSQGSMVRRWLTRREPGWRWRWALNAGGALTTGVVMLVIAVTKFSHGAWMVVLLIPLLVMLFLMINRHYADVARQLSLDDYGGPPPIDHTVLVLVGDLHRGVASALRYAQALSTSAKAVYVETDPERTQKLEEKWGKWGLGVPLVVLTSPYRSLLTPFLDYVNHLLALGERHVVTIVIPEFVPARWWQHLLHNQTALLIKGALLFRKRVVVVDVPFHLR
ncbi:MAG TPA: APC family permease [Candidatus Deferrimicrobiaceae bacterium]|nr:APC family permease [Candidatus Deferrimicrobiaceae bacterium]